MTGIKQGFSIVAGHLLKEFTNLSEQFADAVKDGAAYSGEKIREAVDEFVEPSSVLVEKFTTAVKDGENEQILEAVDELIRPSSQLLHKCKDAVKDSAIFIGEKMLTAMEQSVLPKPVEAEKFADVVKTGTNFAGEKMMKTVEDFTQMVKAFKVSKG
jgi:hypothetical protein